MNPTWQWEFADPGPRPDVSVVLCVYGNTEMTLDCLWAIHQAQAANRARVEVIVVDDRSPDNTLQHVSSIRGLRVIAREENGGFLRAANTGIEAAGGRHILLLNNDTLPQGRWIDPLLELLESRGALVVGSKLVFPDGSVQEAGGIIFNDGSGWNYGRGMAPDEPCVTYARRVDYCSGASILVDGEFLRGRGGFDPIYAPAYYEDTDLCFAAWEAGGEVWYQPESVVVHLEGQSHGTDETSGHKRYQVINRETFVERHSLALRRQLPNDPANVGVARERVRSRILVVDNEVPTPDRDSGSLRQFSLMQGMIEQGYGVTFLPLNGWRREPYTSRLERAGVEVLDLESTWWPHLREIADSVSHVWISRPTVAEATIGTFRSELPRARIVYDTVDLHFLRLERGAELAEGRAARTAQLQEAAAMRDLELHLMAQSNDVVVVSPVERDMLADREGISAVVVPNIHSLAPPALLTSARDRVLFVGGFRHTPNVDAVRWLAQDILPQLRRTHPDTVVRIVGGDLPEDVAELAAEAGLEIAGWVPDVAAEYARARVVVAPLRFGAGLKGKVGEAAAFGVPLVATTVAAEGMGIEPGREALIEDEAAGFASAVARLLDDDVLWTTLSTESQAFISRHFSPRAVGRAVAGLLEGRPVEPAGAAEVDAAVADPSGSALARVAALELAQTQLEQALRLADEGAAALTAEAESRRAAEHERLGAIALRQGATVARTDALLESQSLRAGLDAALQREQRRASVRVARVVNRFRPGMRFRNTVPWPEHLGTLAASGVFDEQWYLDAYPDVAASGQSAFWHYVSRGWREGRSPGPHFDAVWYAHRYDDVRATGIDPAVHYVTWGWRESRLPNPTVHPAAAVSVARMDPAMNPVLFLMARLSTDSQEIELVAGAERRAALEAAPAKPPTREPERRQHARPLHVEGTPREPGLYLLHLHGYKCAGTTFAWILERNFPGRVAYVESESEGRRVPWQRVRNEVDLEGTRAITSHLMTMPDAGAGVASLTVAFVRDPVARLRSAYRFERRMLEWGEPESFDEYLERHANSVASNFQVRHLSRQDGRDFDPQLPLPGWRLHPETIDLGREDLFVGVVERFDESLVVLEHRLRQQGVLFDGAYAFHVNADPVESADEPTWSGLPSMITLEQALRDRANEALDAQLRDLPDAQAAVAQFRQRCLDLRTVLPAVQLPDMRDWTLLPPQPVGRPGW